MRTKELQDALDEAERVRKEMTHVKFPTEVEKALVGLADCIYTLEQIAENNYFDLGDE